MIMMREEGRERGRGKVVTRRHGESKELQQEDWNHATEKSWCCSPKDKRPSNAVNVS